MQEMKSFHTCKLGFAGDPDTDAIPCRPAFPEYVSWIDFKLSMHGGSLLNSSQCMYHLLTPPQLRYWLHHTYLNTRFGKILICNNINVYLKKVIIAFTTLQFIFLNIVHGLIYLIWVKKTQSENLSLKIFARQVYSRNRIQPRNKDHHSCQNPPCQC